MQLQEATDERERHAEDTAVEITRMQHQICELEMTSRRTRAVNDQVPANAA